MADKSIRIRAFALVMGSAFFFGAVPFAPQAARARAQPPDAEIFARVDDRTISLREYRAALATGVRQKFYHGRPPEAELARLGREVGERLIMEVLLSAEAQRREIEPDRAAIARQISEYEQRYAANEQWQRARGDVLPQLTAELERRSRLARLETGVRAAPLPDETESRAYYLANPALFTEPDQVRLSLILLKVQPAAPGSAWDEAMAEAERLHASIGTGADFAELARARSADPSATKGGDLGYLHRGMLPQAIEAQFVDGLQVGAVAKPVRVLEGVAIVRLDARKPPRLRDFDEVAKTARDLLQRERGERAWARLNAELRAAATVKMDESRYATVGAH